MKSQAKNKKIKKSIKLEQIHTILVIGAVDEVSQLFWLIIT